MAKNTAKTVAVSSKTSAKPANVPATASTTVGAKGKAATHLTVAKKPAADEDEDEEDEAPAGKTKKSQKALLTIRVSNMIRKMRQATDFLRDSIAEDEAAAALKALSDLNGAVGLLDANWTRARKEKISQKTFETNQLVAVTDVWKKKYAGLMDEMEMDDLRVVKKASLKNGNAVYSVITADGARLFIAAAHLRAAE